MRMSDIARKVSKAAADNSPAILSAIAITGTVGTAYLTGKASFRAAKILADEKFKRNIEVAKAPVSTSGEKADFETKEKLKLVWKLYIPAVGSGLLTVGCIVGAHRISSRRIAAMASAYAISERAYSEYKDKVVEKLGMGKEQGVRDEIAQDSVTRNPPVDNQIIHTGRGDVLCKDLFTGRYFYSSMEALKSAMNEINYQIIHSDSATVSEFYDKIGLEATSISEDLGWNNDRMLELSFHSALTEKGEPCLTFDFTTVPVREPWRFR
jgi:osmotically-inducible protein OsmY